MNMNILSIHSFVHLSVHPAHKIWMLSPLNFRPEALGSSLKANLTFSVSKSDKTKAESHRPSLWDCDMLNDEPRDKNACRF